jgi:hypothetical protein
MDKFALSFVSLFLFIRTRQNIFKVPSNLD